MHMVRKSIELFEKTSSNSAEKMHDFSNSFQRKTAEKCFWLIKSSGRYSRERIYLLESCFSFLHIVVTSSC